MASHTGGQGLTRRRLFGLIPLPFSALKPAPDDAAVAVLGPDCFVCRTSTFDFPNWPGIEVDTQIIMTTPAKWFGGWEAVCPEMSVKEYGPIVIGISARCRWVGVARD